jgi:hypothetical protein
MRARIMNVCFCASAFVLLIGLPTIGPNGKLEKWGGLGGVSFCLPVAAATDRIWDNQLANGLWFGVAGQQNEITNWDPDGLPVAADNLTDDLSGTITYNSDG